MSDEGRQTTLLSTIDSLCSYALDPEKGNKTTEYENSFLGKDIFMDFYNDFLNFSSSQVFLNASRMNSFCSFGSLEGLQNSTVRSI